MFPASKTVPQQCATPIPELRNTCKTCPKNGACPDGLLHLCTFRRGQNRGLSSLQAPFLPCHEHGSSDRNRRICANQNSNDKREGEASQHLAAEDVQRKNRRERQPGSQDRPAQGLIDASVHYVRERFATAQPEVFPDSIEHDDG